MMRAEGARIVCAEGRQEVGKSPRVAASERLAGRGLEGRDEIQPLLRLVLINVQAHDQRN